MKTNRPKEKDLANLAYAMANISIQWKEEINSDSMSFDHDSQDCYKTFYEKFASQITVIEKYPPEEFNNLRNNIIAGLKTLSKSLMTLYETNKRFFRTLRRKDLMFKIYRKDHPFLHNATDEQLEVYLLPYTEPVDQDSYYQSAFYNSYGFLLNDYHFEIYILCKYFLNVNYSNTQEHNEFRSFIEQAQSAPYFPMGLIYDIYVLANDKQFEKTTELQFYLSINLMNIVPKLRIKKGENKRAFYILHKLSTLIGNLENKNYWLSKILNQLNIDEKSYQSKYREVKGSNALEDDQKFAEKIDLKFRPYNKVN